MRPASSVTALNYTRAPARHTQHTRESPVMNARFRAATTALSLLVPRLIHGRECFIPPRGSASSCWLNRLNLAALRNDCLDSRDYCGKIVLKNDRCGDCCQCLQLTSFRFLILCIESKTCPDIVKVHQSFRLVMMMDRVNNCIN